MMVARGGGANPGLALVLLLPSLVPTTRRDPTPDSEPPPDRPPLRDPPVKEPMRTSEIYNPVYKGVRQ
jgi:hypothetical protein